MMRPWQRRLLCRLGLHNWTLWRNLDRDGKNGGEIYGRYCQSLLCDARQERELVD